jgi:hypothetical protein
MNEQIRSHESEDIIIPPAHPVNGHAVWSRLRNALAGERGYHMTLERLGRIIGRATSTTEHWLDVSSQPHVLAFICMLERLSDDGRARFLREFCRTFPTIMHPCLAQSPRTVADLLRLLCQPRGLTLVRGGTEASRTFLVTALGHSFSQVDRTHRRPAGADIHQPDRLVPIETLFYLRSPLPSERVRHAIHTVWPEIQASTAPLLLFNGVWSSVPELRDEMLDWAQQRHVVVADSETPDPRQLAPKGIGPVHVLTLSLAPQNAWIQVACQAVQ